MTRNQYQEIKKELKELVVDIRKAKPDYKSKQRIYSKGGNAEADYFAGRTTSAEWEEARPLYKTSYIDQIFAMRKVEDLKFEFRWRHILLSLARGKKLNQIEPKTAKDDYQKDLVKRKTYEKVQKMAEELGVEDFNDLFNCGEAA